MAVKVTVCYEMAFVALQLLCHLTDTRLPISRAARIELRHIAVAVLMAFIIVVSGQRSLARVPPEIHCSGMRHMPIRPSHTAQQWSSQLCTARAAISRASAQRA